MEVLAALPPAAKVLDVGPGSGVIGTFLAERGVNELYAVEIDPAAREHVRGIYREVHPSIDAFTGKTFDVIVLLDVLEHMAAPEEFFRHAANLLAPGGIIVVSVPNILHWSVRIPLFFGVFRYYDRGILDRTHLQFFTARRVSDLTSAAPGIGLRERSASIEPAEFVLPKVVWNNPVYGALTSLRIGLARLLPGLFAYQHLAVFRKG